MELDVFSESAYKFVDWLKAAGQSYWQILPLVPTSYGDSPYQSFSTYAGNPYFISLEALIEEGALSKEECDDAVWGEDENSVDYEKMYEQRFKLLRNAYERSNVTSDAGYLKFVEEQAWWLKDYALFMSVKDRFGGAAWTVSIPGHIRNCFNWMLTTFHLQPQAALQMVSPQQVSCGIKLASDCTYYAKPRKALYCTNAGLFGTDLR